MKIEDRRILRDFEVGRACCSDCQTKGSLWPTPDEDVYICVQCNCKYDDKDPTPKTLKLMSW